MKKFFFLGIMGFAVLWGVGYFLYRVALAFMDIYDDWRLGKEVREIEREAQQRRREKDRLKQEEQQRRTTERERIELADSVAATAVHRASQGSPAMEARPAEVAEAVEAAEAMETAKEPQPVPEEPGQVAPEANDEDVIDLPD